MAQEDGPELENQLASAMQNAFLAQAKRIIGEYLAADWQSHGVVLNDLQRADLVDQVLQGGQGKLAVELADTQEKAVRARYADLIPDDLTINLEGLQIKIDKLEGIAEAIFADAIRSILRDWPNLLLNRWTEDAPRTYAEMRAEQAEFETEVHKRWGNAIDSLDALISICRDIGQDFSSKVKKSQANDDPMLKSLIFLHMRSCQVSCEVATLLRAGLADGAVARWRTLHELAVTAAFIAKHGPSIAQRYLDHADMQTYLAAKEYQKYSQRLGRQPISAADMASLETRKAELVAKYGSEFEQHYGWAIPALPKPKHPKQLTRYSFSGIELSVGLDHVRPFVQTAHDSIHAGSRGTAFRISAAWAGASDVGLELPGRNTAWSLILVTARLLGQRPDLEWTLTAKAILQLGPPIYRAFDEAAY
jgi:hypothetical protein